MPPKTASNKNINYLLAGHVSKDLAPDGAAGYKLGGGVLYSGAAAKVLGASVGVITSYPKTMHREVSKHAVLKDLVVKNIPSRAATTFRNVYVDQKRTQYLFETAAPITAAGLSKTGLGSSYFSPSFIHLAPIAREVDASFIDKISGDFFGATLQGWLRKRDSSDRVLFSEWKDSKNYLGRLDAAVVSEEDVNNDAALVKKFAAQTKILVVTRGKNGCSVFQKNKRTDIKPKKVLATSDTTGAGDVFAAGFFTKYYHSKDPVLAAEFANRLAAFHLEKGISSLK